MFLKSKLLVLFLALAIFAAPEGLMKPSGEFVFKQGVGVKYQTITAMNGLSFTCKKINAGKNYLAFSWTLPQNKAQIGKISFYSVSGKLIKSFNLTTPEGSINWSMTTSKLASGIYLARLSYGSFNRSVKIVY
jgi:hypothetical protein